MVNWSDLLHQAQGGRGLDNLAENFGLSPSQTSTIAAALMPAFAMGLQQMAANPQAVARLSQSMLTGPYRSFFDTAGSAFSPQAKRDGQVILDQIFGSDEVSLRVAHQAASFSGVGADILHQMLPLIAGIVAGGLAKLATAQGITAVVQPPSSKRSPPDTQSWLEAWAGLWGMELPNSKKDEQVPQSTQFEDIMASFIKPFSPPEEAQPDEPEVNKDPNQAWHDLVQSGQELQREHLASLQAIFAGLLDRRDK